LSKFKNSNVCRSKVLLFTTSPTLRTLLIRPTYASLKTYIAAYKICNSHKLFIKKELIMIMKEVVYLIKILTIYTYFHAFTIIFMQVYVHIEST
jgi:hypothetical protein